jgi:hypothetical protein
MKEEKKKKSPEPYRTFVIHMRPINAKRMTRHSQHHRGWRRWEFPDGPACFAQRAQLGVFKITN